jgi:hypothetical protein
LLDFVHPDDLQASLALLAGLAPERRDLIEAENRVICADGSERRLHWNMRTSDRGIPLRRALLMRRVSGASGALPRPSRTLVRHSRALRDELRDANRDARPRIAEGSI